MELIIKPTGRCNFACSFCAAGKTHIKHQTRLSDVLKHQIDVLQPSSLIINGGEPLLSGIDFFTELLDFYSGHIAIISNLKCFYEDPKTWIPLFLNPRISVVTSFQYGSGRKWDANTVYDESMFRRICRMFKEHAGYVPMFISVISEENEKRAIDHVYLAKELGTICKLNPLLPIGFSKNFYPIHKMIKIWLQIKQLDLEKYTDTLVQFYHGGCQFNTSLMCANTIRVFYENSDGSIAYSNCDNKAMSGHTMPLDAVKPIPCPTKLNMPDLISTKCLSCELCRLCNACCIARSIAKKDKNHCVEMLKLKSSLLKSGWAI